MIQAGPAAHWEAMSHITHAVVIPHRLMLVIRIRLTRLHRVPFHPFLRLLVRADQGTAPGGRDHLVAVERQHAVTSLRGALPLPYTPMS